MDDLPAYDILQCLGYLPNVVDIVTTVYYVHHRHHCHYSFYYDLLVQSL
jgi:hypothetical protein